MPKLGSRSLLFSHHVDPLLMEVNNLAISSSSVDWGFTEDQSRTAAQQMVKYHSGVSHLPAGPKARHMIQPDGFSKAIDAVPWIDSRFQWGDGQWRVHTIAGPVIQPFFVIAAQMRQAAIILKTKIRWGAVWDKLLNDLPADEEGLRAEVDRYKTRHPGPDFLDGPHFELPI